MNNTDKSLKECVKCSSTYTALNIITPESSYLPTDGYYGYFVICDNCDCRGATEDTKQEAINSWNEMIGRRWDDFISMKPLEAPKGEILPLKNNTWTRQEKFDFLEKCGCTIDCTGGGDGIDFRKYDLNISYKGDYSHAKFDELSVHDIISDLFAMATCG